METWKIERGEEAADLQLLIHCFWAEIIVIIHESESVKLCSVGEKHMEGALCSSVDTVPTRGLEWSLGRKNRLLVQWFPVSDVC